LLAPYNYPYYTELSIHLQAFEPKTLVYDNATQEAQLMKQEQLDYLPSKMIAPIGTKFLHQFNSVLLTKLIKTLMLHSHKKHTAATSILLTLVIHGKNVKWSGLHIHGIGGEAEFGSRTKCCNDNCHNALPTSACNTTCNTSCNTSF
jgi:hypothetical protein